MPRHIIRIASYREIVVEGLGGVDQWIVEDDEDDAADVHILRISHPYQVDVRFVWFWQRRYRKHAIVA